MRALCGPQRLALRMTNKFQTGNAFADGHARSCKK